MKNLKTITITFLALLLVFGLTACSGGGEKQGSEPSATVGGLDLEQSPSASAKEKKFELELVGQDVISRDYGYVKVGFKVKNNSAEPVSSPSISVNMLDANGDIVDTTSAFGVSTIDPGQSAILDCTMKEDASVASVKAGQTTYYLKNDSGTQQFQGTFSNATPLPLQ